MSAVQIQQSVTANQRPPKRAAPRSKKERAPKVPKIVKPPPFSLAELPDEVIDHIASFLTPKPLLEESGLVSPLVRGYGPHHKAITANHAFRNERFGAIPLSLGDLFSFARSCRKAMRVCLPTVSGYGVSRKSVDAKPDVQATIRFDPIATAPKKQLYIRLEHIGENGDNLLQLMLDNRETLEEVVIHGCGSHDENKSRQSQHEITDPRSAFAKTTPFQQIYKDKVPLPALRRIQLGPDLCVSCVRIALRLFTAKLFQKLRSRTHNTFIQDQWDIGQSMVMDWQGRTDNYEHYPAPALRSIQILVPDMIANTHRMNESDRVRRFLECIPTVTAEKIEIFSIVLRGQMDRRWGGFGVSGGTTRLVAKTKEQADAELTERALIVMAPHGPSIKQQREDAAKSAAAKFASLMSAAKPKIQPTAKDEAGEALAKAATAGLEARKEKEQPGAKAPEENKDVPVAASIGDEGNANDPASDGIEVTLNANDTDIDATDQLPVVDGTEATATTLDKGKGKAVEEDVARPQTLNTTFEEDDITVPIKVDKGKGKATDELPATLNIAAMQDGVDPALQDVSDDESDDSEPKVDAAAAPEAEASGNDGKAPNAQARNHVANHIRMEDQIATILRQINNRLPNLVSLQVVRGGSVRTDILEGPDSLTRMMECCVQPIQNLTSLRHLDLGLAVLGQREARDFPIGLHVPAVDVVKAAAKYGPTRARILGLRHNLHVEDIKRATRKEGDAWRIKVIQKFALGKGDGQEAEGASPALPVTWPKGIKSGFVYSPDIVKRTKYRGFLTAWEKDMVNGQEVLKWTRHDVVL